MNLRRVQVESLDQLRTMAQRPIEAYILVGELLTENAFRSSKSIHYQHNRNGRHWWMYESIGDSERYYTERQFASDTNIVEAIGKAALYVEIDIEESRKILTQE